MLTDKETILRNTTRLKIDPVNLPFDRGNRFADKKTKRNTLNQLTNKADFVLFFTLFYESCDGFNSVRLWKKQRVVSFALALSVGSNDIVGDR